MPRPHPALLLSVVWLSSCGVDSALRVDDPLTSPEDDGLGLGERPSLHDDPAPAAVDVADVAEDDTADDAAAGYDLASQELAALAAALEAGVPLPETASVRSAATASRPLDELEQLFVRHFNVPSAQGITERSANANAYACLAAANALARADDGAGFTAAQQQDFLTAVQRTTDALVATMPRWSGDGWGLRESWDAFSDGTTNPASTAYAFQTGLVLWCFADAARVLASRQPQRAAQLLTKARAVLTEYGERSYVSVSRVGSKSCSASNPCGHFYYSRSANDRGRFVKNTNVLMGAASFALGRAAALPPTGTLMARANASVRSQVYEVTQGNFGYLGRSDRGWSARFDAHNTLEMYSLLHVAELRRTPSYLCRALQHYRGYYGHTEDTAEITASCHLARRHAGAKSRCKAGLPRYHTPNVLMGLVMDYWPTDTRSATQHCAAAGMTL